MTSVKQVKKFVSGFYTTHNVLHSIEFQYFYHNNLNSVRNPGNFRKTHFRLNTTNAEHLIISSSNNISQYIVSLNYYFLFILEMF